MNCKYCPSDNIIKYGSYKGTQYYYCKVCKRKFASLDKIPKMQYETDKVADALNMYYEGMSLLEIRRNLIQQYQDYPSDASIYNWYKRFTKHAVIEADKHKPNVGSIWVADETVIDIDGKNVWFWDLIDTKTRFLIASHMSYTRTSKDAEHLMKQAHERTGKIPRIIYTDKLAAYLDGIELTFGADTEHRRGSPFDIGNNANYIERFHSTLKSRTKVMRGLNSLESARLFLDGWLVHYNFFRPHMSLNDMTPAVVAGIRFPFRNWKDVLEQPYENTSRISAAATCKPILDEPVVVVRVKPKASPKQVMVKRKSPKVERQPTILRGLRTR